MNSKPGAAAEIPENLWMEISPRIKAGIAAEFDKLQDKDPLDKSGRVDWMRAFLTYLRIIEGPQKKRWWGEHVTELMAVSAAMALAFGMLGAWGLSSGGPKEATSGFLDIAKLFAGALVGAAGATVAKR